MDAWVKVKALTHMVYSIESKKVQMLKFTSVKMFFAINETIRYVIVSQTHRMI